MVPYSNASSLPQSSERCGFTLLVYFQKHFRSAWSWSYFLLPLPFSHVKRLQNEKMQVEQIFNQARQQYVASKGSIVMQCEYSLQVSSRLIAPRHQGSVILGWKYISAMPCECRRLDPFWDKYSQEVWKFCQGRERFHRHAVRVESLTDSGVPTISNTRWGCSIDLDAKFILSCSLQIKQQAGSKWVQTSSRGIYVWPYEGNSL